ncbi:MAG: antibiotic biosynthesis monooxygenase [Candidatus Aminicenantes bacterium]|nr:antibiotic biosynthesis monooxygenase [Candidatus Aminicenantes bacterium]
MKQILIDVRTREEFVMEHVKGAANIPHYDLEYYRELLRDREVVVYCNTGRRSAIAAKKLAAMGIAVDILPAGQMELREKEGKAMVCAVNYVSPHPDREEEFVAKAADLCRATEEVPGFLGSKIFKLSGISAAGSGVTGDTNQMNVAPPCYLLLTYWESEAAHERSHRDPKFAAIFKELPANLVRMPYEEFYQVLK